MQNFQEEPDRHLKIKLLEDLIEQIMGMPEKAPAGEQPAAVEIEVEKEEV